MPQEPHPTNYGADSGLVRRLSVFVIAGATLPMVIGLSVLAGWTVNVAAVLTWGGETAVAPNTAACMMLAGLSLWLLRERSNRPFASYSKRAAKALAVVVSLTGLFTLGENLFVVNLGIDRLLLLRPHGPSIATLHMSSITAGAFLLFGLALLGIDWRTRRERWPAQYLCLLSAIAPVFGGLGFLLGLAVSPVFPALPTVVALFTLTAGFLCSRPSWAMGGLLTRRSPAASLLRSALPGALLVLGLLGLLGWLISKPLLSGISFTWVEVSALAIVTGALLVGLIGWTAFLVERGGERETRAQASLLIQIQPDTQTEEPEMEARLRRWVKAVAAVGALLTVLLSLLSWRAARQATETANWVAHTQEVMTVLESTLRHSVDVETGGCGFAETGSGPFLEPYKSGRPAVFEDLHALRLLVVDPDQLRRLTILDEQANNQVGDVEEVVAARQNTGEIPAVALFGQGQHDMDAVRITVGQMEMAERGLLASRTQRARAAQHSSIVVIALGSLLGVVFLFIAGMRVSREIGVSARARAQIKALNADLEQRVEQRTAALEAEAAARRESEGRLAALNEELEERIAKRTDQLAATNHELETFSYSVSHDLRVPLRHIAGFSGILVNKFGPVMGVEAREYLQLIENAVRRMGLLVEGLLSLAKLGQQSLKLCRTELNAIVDGVISILGPDCEGREVEWRIAKLPALDCDPILMGQVFQNLLGNALKYSRGRARAVIEVDSIQQPGRAAIIFVRDNGAGFTMKNAERLFGVFQRFHADSEFEGTGVGLATVYRIIKKHGGMIWAESEPDHGATFYFALQMVAQVVTARKALATS
jgi:signal transduction histidine kinase